MPPAVLALIGSPHQALGFLEYVRENGITRGTVMLPRLAEPAMLRPTMNVLERLRGFSFQFRRTTGFRKPDAHTGTVAADIVALAREKHAIEALVIGDYRDTAGWRIASLLELDAREIIVLDDGASTLAIDRSQGGFEPLQWSSEAEGEGFMPPPAVTFFTSMPDLLRAAPGDTVIANHWAWLTGRYSNLRRSGSLVLVVGQGFSRVRLMDERDEIELAHLLVDTAGKLHPGCSPLYVAHRGETLDKLRAVAEVSHVVRFDIPLEMVPIEAGVLPAGIVGHYSTALTTLASLAPADLPVHAQRIPADRLLDRQEYIAEVYRRLEGDLGGRITVID